MTKHTNGTDAQPPVDVQALAQKLGTFATHAIPPHVGLVFVLVHGEQCTVGSNGDALYFLVEGLSVQHATLKRQAQEAVKASSKILLPDKRIIKPS